MKSRFLFRALAAGLIVLGFGALDARAGFVPLPTTYDALTPTGSFTTVDGRPTGGEFLTFSNFTFTSTSVPPGSEVSPANVLVTPYTVGNETGFSLVGAGLFAPINTLVDVKISYVVTAEPGHYFTDAQLVTTGGILGTTGGYSVSETILNGNSVWGSMNANAGSPAAFINAPPGVFATSLLVTKDIFISGGNGGTSLSDVTQAFSSAVPEPASWALLGIGMTGFLAFRRFFKKTQVA
jgi:PEP-CTERM motif